MAPTDIEHHLTLTVGARRTGAEGVVVLDLGAPDGVPLPAWTPGAHIDLELDDGLVRQYSLCGDTPRDEQTWRIAPFHVVARLVIEL